jgi:aryl-alcohol dehydrogenase-like predicted oxidoreductase
MEYRVLGRTGLLVSTFSFGAMTFGGTGKFETYGQVRGAEARRLIDMTLEAGVNLFDTANVYSAGQSEAILGEALGARRKDVIVATKCNGVMGPGPNDCGSSRRHIVESCEASLKRLKTDYIDLYQLHNQDSLTAPEEAVRALDDLVRAGKVRYIGSSNFSAWYKMKALAASERFGLARYASQQIQYSLLWRDAEDELLRLGVEERVGALIWSPLAGGYLTGKFRGGPGGAPTRIDGEKLSTIEGERAQRILNALDEIAGARPGVSLGQIALNWVVRKAGVTSVIVGARNEAQLADNLAAAAWSLTDAEMARLDEASRPPPRYPYSLQVQAAPHRNPPLPLQPPVRVAG